MQKHQVALGIIKADGVGRGLTDTVCAELRRKNLFVVTGPQRNLSRDEIDMLYPHQMKLQIYPVIKEFMVFGPSQIIAIFGFGSEAKMDGIKIHIRNRFYLPGPESYGFFPQFPRRMQNVFHSSYAQHETEHFLRM